MRVIWAWCRRWSRSAVAATAVVAVVGLLVSTAAGVILARDERKAAEQQLQRRARLVAEALTAETRRYEDALITVAAATGAFESLTAAKFAQVTASLAELRLAGATSIAYMVPARDDEIAAVQAHWRDRGVPDLVLTPVGTGKEHIFSVLNQPLDGVATPRYGIDATQSGPASRALTEARRTGRAAVSDPYQLIIDQQLPAAQRQMSFIVTVPVYGRGDAPGRRVFRGWVLMGLRGGDFIGDASARAAQDLVDVTLRAPSADGTFPLVAQQRAAATGRRDVTYDATITVADREWRLRIEAAAGALPGGITHTPAVITGALAALTLLLALLVWVLATGRRRALRQVRVATAELADAEAGARHQADLLAAIMDNISDGVGVVDHNGDFLLHNPAAKAILGVDDDHAGADSWQDHYGIYRPDGHTPFPVEEMPLMRGLAGECTDQVEMVLRNPGHPDGAVITVSGRPLRSGDGLLGAVAVFHDITARKAAEADLRAFAGVAAHDLKAPLTAIAGYAELLQDELADAASPTVRHGVQRISAGIDRMRRLIDALLAYATARDGELDLQPVDLQRLVTDVITERTAHLRARGDGEPDLFPDIYTGPLPTVHADPAMIRQVLDNLIGNAIKYAMPGQPTRIDIAAHRRPGDAQVRVVIADRGIGIPAAEQPHVFDAFHRAANHGGRPGTGLGLAICRRIVSRHGGTIAVTDNPGGGSRFHFTLPLATSTTPPDAAPARQDAAIPAGHRPAAR